MASAGVAGATEGVATAEPWDIFCWGSHADDSNGSLGVWPERVGLGDQVECPDCPCVMWVGFWPQHVNMHVCCKLQGKPPEDPVLWRYAAEAMWAAEQQRRARAKARRRLDGPGRTDLQAVYRAELHARMQRRRDSEAGLQPARLPDREPLLQREQVEVPPWAPGLQQVRGVSVGAWVGPLYGCL